MHLYLCLYVGILPWQISVALDLGEYPLLLDSTCHPVLRDYDWETDSDSWLEGGG
jgi:hypothetical protein